jgi:hypothetical protein
MFACLFPFRLSGAPRWYLGLRQVQFPQLTRDISDLGELPAGYPWHERLRGVDVHVTQRHLVQCQEDARGGPGEPLVAIGQGIVHAERMQQGGGLLPRTSSPERAERVTMSGCFVPGREPSVAKGGIRL